MIWNCKVRERNARARGFHVESMHRGSAFWVHDVPLGTLTDVDTLRDDARYFAYWGALSSLFGLVGDYPRCSGRSSVTWAESRPARRSESFDQDFKLGYKR